MSVARYALALVELAIVLGGFSLAGVTLRRRLVGEWQGPPALLAAALLTIALLVGALELLGAAHLFRGWTIAAAGALAGAVAVRAGGGRRAAPARALDGAALVAILAGLLVPAEWLVPTLDSLSHGIRTVDTLWYHLPWSVSYVQRGEITALRFSDFEYLTTFYPATSELLHGAAIALVSRDTLSPLINLGWLVLELLAAWCIGARRGLGPHAVLAAAVVLGAPMMVLSQAGSAANDVVGIFFVTAGVAFWLEGSGERGATILAALAAGLALGTKLSVAAPAVLLALAAIAAERRRATALRWFAGLALGSGFWFARNLIAVGNPFPWWHLPGLAAPAPPMQAGTGYSLAHYLLDGRIWSRFLIPGLHSGFGLGWAPLLAALIASPIALIAGARELRLRLFGAVALGSLLIYAITPETAAGPAGDPIGFAFNVRYGAPAFVLCLLCTALLPAVWPRIRTPIAALLGALLVLGTVRASLWPARHAAAAVVIALALGATGVLARGARAGRRQRRSAAVPAIACLVIAIGGWFVPRSYLDGRYRYARGVSQMSVVWQAFRGIHGARVALSGTYGATFALPLSGRDLSDSVTYVGMGGSAGSFTPIGSCRAWRRAIDAGHYRYLVATPSRDPWHPKTLTPSPEAGWTRGDPHARIVLAHTGAGATIYLFRLYGPLDPAGCG